MRLLKMIAAPLLAALAWLGGPFSASAHPHVWVVVETEVLYDGQKAITGFRHKWTFDEAYTSFAVEGLDKNSDGKYDRGELQELAEVNINSLKEFGYFTFPALGKQPLEALSPRDYWLEHANGTLTLYFTLPLKEMLTASKTKDFRFAVYDPTFYVDFALAKGTPIRLSAAPTGCTAVINEPDPKAAEAATAAATQLDQTPGGAASLNLDAALYAKSVRIACPAG